jgi:hypothetical protein
VADEYKLDAQPATLSVTVNDARLVRVRAVLRKRPVFYFLSFVVTFGSPLLGLRLLGLPGFVVGEVLAVGSWYLSTKAIIAQVRREER